MALDVNALIAKAKAEAKAAQEAADKARAEADATKAKTKEANKIQIQANNKFDYANSLKKSLQTIEDEIMIYVRRLSYGDKLTPQEQKRLDDLGKQYNSVSTNYTNTMNEGNRILSAMPKESKPSIETTKETKTKEETKVVLRDYAAEISTAGKAIAKMDKATRLGLAQKLKAAGYNVPTDGNYSDQLISGYIQAIADNQIRSTNFDKEIPMKEFLSVRAGEGAGGVPGAGGGPQVTLYPEISNPQDGRAIINKYFQDKFGRDATDAEFKAAYAEVIKQQKANPRQQTVTTDSKGRKIVAYTGGTNTEQILKAFIDKKPKLKQEATVYEASDAKVIQRQKDKEAYESLVAQAGNDPDKIAALQMTTSYGRSIKGMSDRIARIALEAGAELSATELAEYAKEAIDQSLDTSAESLTAYINSKLKFKPGTTGAFKGVAGENVDTLAKTAAANGLDLQKAFGTQLPDWLASINKGESIDTYKKIIRDVAKIGMPEKVAKLIDQGVDLATIYAPYKNVMASTLELNPQSITLDDPTLRAAISAEKEVPIYEFERALRKDNRWQYTNQARKEVSGAVQKVLQDFGFMG